MALSTATEVGGTSVVYAPLVSWLALESTDVASLRDALKRSARMTTPVYLVIAAAMVVSNVLTIGGIAGWVQDTASLLAGSPTLFLLALAGILLLVATVLEPGASIVVSVPMLVPVATTMQIDPMQFATVVILTLTLGLISPPVGGVLFVACRVADRRIMPTTRAIVPFLLAEIGVIVLLAFTPGLLSFGQRLRV